MIGSHIIVLSKIKSDLMSDLSKNELIKFTIVALKWLKLLYHIHVIFQNECTLNISLWHYYINEAFT